MKFVSLHTQGKLGIDFHGQKAGFSSTVINSLNNREPIFYIRRANLKGEERRTFKTSSGSVGIEVGPIHVWRRINQGLLQKK